MIENSSFLTLKENDQSIRKIETFHVLDSKIKMEK